LRVFHHEPNVSPYVPDPKNPDPPNPRFSPFSPFPILPAIKTEIRFPNRNKQAGFSPTIIGYSWFYALKPVIWKQVIKNNPFRPVGSDRLKREDARIEIVLPF
jgi:hypothetical protein